MFIINGHVDGTTYEDRQVSAEDLIKMFSLPVDFDAKNKQVSFELLETQRKYDRWNKMTRTQIAKLIRTNFQGIYNGNSIEIQYFRRKSRKRENGVNVINYVPHHMPYSGDVVPFSIDMKHKNTDLEPLVFFMLHPKCEDSPIGANVKRKYYRINDVVGKATKKVLEKRRFVEIYNLILDGEDEHMLRNKAAAFGISEHRMELEEVQNALVERAESDIDSFRKVFDDTKHTFEGLLNRARAHGIIVSKSTGGGVSSFGFNEQISQRLYQEVFHTISQYRIGNNGFAELKAAVAKDPKLISQINDLLQENDTDTAIMANITEDMLSGKNVKDKEEDEFEMAAKWIVANKLVELEDGMAKYKQTDKRSLKLGEIEQETELIPQIAFLLSQESSEYAMNDIRKKMDE